MDNVLHPLLFVFCSQSVHNARQGRASLLFGARFKMCEAVLKSVGSEGKRGEGGGFADGVLNIDRKTFCREAYLHEVELGRPRG